MAQLCFAQIILFNRKRSGEAHKMKYSQVLQAMVNEKAPDACVLASLNPFEVSLAKTLELKCTWQVHQTSPAGTSYRPHTTCWKLGHCDLFSPL